MKIRPFFRWFDLWIGAYVWWPARTIFICPLPTIGLRIEFPESINNEVLLNVMDEHTRLQKLTSKELVAECLKIPETDMPVIEEMMTRLDPHWADE